ncbi:MAG: hemolysin family protein [Oscillospiraceae bacterium]
MKAFGKQESELVQSALEFDEIQAGEILTPRVDVLAVDITDSIQEIGELLLHPYSRIPVFEKSIDNIVGVLHQREFFRSMVAGEPFTIADLLQKTLHVPPSVKISALLRQMQLNKIQMAVVTDQYGGTLGVVTLEDIIEELVGDIWDESDIVTEAIQRIGENAYAVSGDMNVYDMFETIDCEYHGEEITSNSVSGWFLELLGRIPSKGESIDCAGLRLTVQDVDGKRIKKLTVQKLTSEAPAKEKE